MVSPHREANTATMQHFLNAAAKQLGPRQHVVMVLDRAGWHTAKQVKWPRRITSLFLSPYSSELNPAERLWLWFRERHWSNRVYPDEPSLIHEAKRSLHQLRRAEVRSICATRWVTREDQV
jgi:transposase